MTSHYHGSKIYGSQQKQWWWWQQWERQKSNRFDKQNNNFACEQAFYTFLSRRCATVTWNFLRQAMGWWKGKNNILISVVSYNSIQALSSESVILAGPWLERQKPDWAQLLGSKLILLFCFSLTGQERFGNMTRVCLFVLHHVRAPYQVTFMLWFNFILGLNQG